LKKKLRKKIIGQSCKASNMHNWAVDCERLKRSRQPLVNYFHSMILRTRG
jgi:hypothetical protein